MFHCIWSHCAGLHMADPFNTQYKSTGTLYACVMDSTRLVLLPPNARALGHYMHVCWTPQGWSFYHPMQEHWDTICMCAGLHKAGPFTTQCKSTGTLYACMLDSTRLVLLPPNARALRHYMHVCWTPQG